MADGITPSQTIGPFYFGTLIKAYHHDLAPPDVAGEHIALALTLHDVDGVPIPDGMLEIWQANSHGRYDHPEDRRNLPLDAHFDGFGRASTDTEGCARFTTVRPGRVPWPAGGLQASHISVSVFARGVLNRLATRLYFDGDPALSDDPVLRLIEPGRWATLIARRDAGGVWSLPIYIGGDRETVFFDC